MVEGPVKAHFWWKKKKRREKIEKAIEQISLSPRKQLRKGFGGITKADTQSYKG